AAPFVALLALRQAHLPSLRHSQPHFLVALPRSEPDGQVTFRDFRCRDRQEEASAQMVALSWLFFVRLVRQGKDPMQFPSAIATFAARQVRSGRRLCGQEKSKDVLSPRARQRRNFKVEPLPASTRRSPGSSPGSRA